MTNRLADFLASVHQSYSRDRLCPSVAVCAESLTCELTGLWHEKGATDRPGKVLGLAPHEFESVFVAAYRDTSGGILYRHGMLPCMLHGCCMSAVLVSLSSPPVGWVHVQHPINCFPVSCV